MTMPHDEAQPENRPGEASASSSSHDLAVADFAARADLYRYVTRRENAQEFLAVMRLFTSSLLTDRSAAEVHAALAGEGTLMRLEDVENRCRQLEAWGNLVRSVRDAKVATVTEYLRSKARYQVSKLGGQVQRQVEDILSAGAGAREVSRELLGGTAAMLSRIADSAEAIARHRSQAIGSILIPEGVDVEAVAADVTQVFLNQRAFTESATDFYAYVQSRMSRYDLTGEEYAAFKTMLLDYVELISADVRRHAPGIAATLRRIEPHLQVLLDALDTLPGLNESQVERSPGRRREEWDQLTASYTGSRGRSGPEQLRDAADRALRQLLTNARRMVSSASTGISRRADLLTLATWFDKADTEEAHRLYDAAFGLYPARHPIHGLAEPNGRAGVMTSWWDDEPVDVPVSLRERGSRAAKGRTAMVPDFALQREALVEEVRLEHERDRAAAAELATAGDLDGATLSPAALGLMLTLLSDLLARSEDLEREANVVNTELDVVLTVAPRSGTTTTIHCPDGDMVVHDLSLSATPAGSVYAADVEAVVS